MEVARRRANWDLSKRAAIDYDDDDGDDDDDDDGSGGGDHII
jgi:hypothetical protein